jgi:hypothetical protein
MPARVAKGWALAMAAWGTVSDAAEEVDQQFGVMNNSASAIKIRLNFTWILPLS